MIADLIQTHASGEKIYELNVDGITYKFKCPWVNIVVQNISVTDALGIVGYKNEDKSLSINVNPLENEIRDIASIKSILKLKSIKDVGLIINKDGTKHGNFYTHISKILDSKDVYLGDLGEYQMRYIDSGRMRKYMVYNTEGKQMAEIRQPGRFKNNCIKYRIFLKDEYKQMLEIIALHLVFLDRKRGRGFAMAGEKIVINYSYSVANKIYDKDWIYKYFEHSKIDDRDFFR